MTVFPDTSVMVTVGRSRTRETILAAGMPGEARIITAVQIEAGRKQVSTIEDVYRTCTLCTVERTLELSDGGMQVQVTGIGRLRLSALEFGEVDTYGSTEVVSELPLAAADLRAAKASIAAPLRFALTSSSGTDTADSLSLIEESESGWEVIGLTTRLLGGLLPPQTLGVADCAPEDRRRIDEFVAGTQRILEEQDWGARFAMLTGLIESTSRA